MNPAQILLGSYLIIGLLATLIILAALRASKHQKEHRTDDREHNKTGQGLFRSQKTRPGKSN